MSNSALQRDVTKFAPQCRAIKLQVQAGDQENVETVGETENRYRVQSF